MILEVMGIVMSLYVLSMIIIGVVMYIKASKY